MSRLRHREPTGFLRNFVVNGHYWSFCKPGCPDEATGMHTLLEYQGSKPRGLPKESFQYCRGPTLPLRMTLLNELMEEIWRRKSMYLAAMVQNLAAEGT